MADLILDDGSTLSILWGDGTIRVGDTITISGVVRRRWWQFWLWFRKPQPLKQFVVTGTQP